MRIILFEIFGIQIKSYGLMIAIGIIVASAIFINEGKKKGFDEDSLLNLIIIAVIGGVLSTSQFIVIFTLAFGIITFNNHTIFKGAKKNIERQ